VKLVLKPRDFMLIKFCDYRRTMVRMCSTFLEPWAQFYCKRWGDSLGWNQHVHPVDAEVKFRKYNFPISLLEVFW